MCFNTFVAWHSVCLCKSCKVFEIAEVHVSAGESNSSINLVSELFSQQSSVAEDVELTVSNVEYTGQESVLQSTTERSCRQSLQKN